MSNQMLISVNNLPVTIYCKEIKLKLLHRLHLMEYVEGLVETLWPNLVTFHGTS